MHFSLLIGWLFVCVALTINYYQYDGVSVNHQVGYWTQKGGVLLDSSLLKWKTSPRDPRSNIASVTDVFDRLAWVWLKFAVAIVGLTILAAYAVFLVLFGDEPSTKGASQHIFVWSVLLGCALLFISVLVSYIANTSFVCWFSQGSLWFGFALITG